MSVISGGIAPVGPGGEPADAALVAFRQLFGDVIVPVDQWGTLKDAVDPRLDLWLDRLS